MFWMRAYPLRGQVGGDRAQKIESFLGPVKWHRADRRVPFGAQKTRTYSTLFNTSSSAALRFLCVGKWCYRNRTVATFCIDSLTINLLADCLHLHVLFIIRSVNCSSRLKIFRFPIRAHYTAIVSL
jgi:hypothetical protein